MAKADRSNWVKGDDIAKYAKLGLDYTRMMLKHGPSNEGFKPLQRVKTMVTRWSYSSVPDDPGLKNASGIGEATQVYEKALRIKTGNCTEHAAVAFIYLYRLKVRPIHMLGYNAGKENHMFVAVGLDLEAPNFTIMTPGSDRWSRVVEADSSYICDPWRNVSYRAVTDFYNKEPQAAGLIEVQAYAE